MDITRFIAKRIAFNRQRTFSRFIIRLAAAATALSVAAMIITMAFVNGFQTAISNKVFGFWGYLHVQEYEPEKSLVSEETPVPYNDTVIQVMASVPDIKHIQAFVTKSVVLEKNKEIEGVLFKGVDTQYDFKNLSPFIKSGKAINFKDSLYSHDIMISQPIANSLKIEIGDSINVYFISQLQGKASVRKLNVCAIYKTGIDEYDKLFAIGDIRLLRRMYDWQQNEIGGYEVFLSNDKNMDTINNLLYQLLPGRWVSRTIKEIYPNIFDWLQIQDVNRNVIFIIMSIVAIINLITCLIILILERTRMVGVLKAVGSTNWGIQKIFLYHASIIAGGGIGIGLIVGLGLCLLQQYTGFIKLDEAAYYVSTAPVDIIWWQVIAICLCTLFVCFLALLLPTFIVRNISPVKAIQFR